MEKENREKRMEGEKFSKKRNEKLKNVFDETLEDKI